LKTIRTKEENKAALAVLSELMDFSNAGKLSVDELEYYRVLRILVREYEKNAAKPIEKPTPGEMLEFFMEHNDLKQVDLIPELGSQTVVSYILGNKRLPTIEQAHDLAKRFGVDPVLFIGDPRTIKANAIDRRTRGGKRKSSA
jgi:HTH-type transcriptional regulator/antitoxin HigA